MPELLTFTGHEPEVEVRSESAREIAIAFMKYGELGRTAEGLEEFERGAFDGTDPLQVILRAEHEGPPAGRGIAIEERGDRSVLIAKAAPTARGDELMTLAREGYFRGASPSFLPKEGGTKYRNHGRERVTVRTAVDLREVSLTWRPTYAGTEVLYTRTQENEPVDTPTTADAVGAQPQPRGMELPTDPHLLDDIRNRLEAIEQRSATPTHVELPTDKAEVPSRGLWVKGALTKLDGGSLNPAEERALADIISDDNAGFMPTVYSDELIGVIDPQRRFLNSTRRIDMPANGLEISYPRITQRPTVAEQLTEKAEVSSTAVETDRVTRAVRTFAGAGDLSIQLLRRSSPEFLNAYLELLGEAYARTTENAAVDALLAAGVTAGGSFDVENPLFGEAFENAVAVGSTLIPDRIWLSTSALSAMIDAKTPTGGGGTSMYPTLASIAGVSNGNPGGPIPVNLTPVWVPALDDEAVDIIVGPSSGFRWGEEGTFTLTADVPGKLGRDVALAGFMVFVDLYPAAFTTYSLAT
jgi:phage head maturation protease